MRLPEAQSAGFGAVLAAASIFAFAAAREPAGAQAVARGYSFAGGTARERATVNAALAASSFDWSRVPGHVTIHVVPGRSCFATPGQIWLGRRVLAHGRAAWGLVQHEYGHEVDFLVLDARARASLNRVLGGKVWWPNGRWRHDQYGAERFASTLAWSYWPSPRNTLVRNARAEATAMRPAAFRRLLRRLLR
jgi:hypothetical protein